MNLSCCRCQCIFHSRNVRKLGRTNHIPFAAWLVMVSWRYAAAFAALFQQLAPPHNSVTVRMSLFLIPAPFSYEVYECFHSPLSRFPPVHENLRMNRSKKLIVSYESTYELAPQRKAKGVPALVFGQKVRQIEAWTELLPQIARSQIREAYRNWEFPFSGDITIASVHEPLTRSSHCIP